MKDKKRPFWLNIGGWFTFLIVAGALVFSFKFTMPLVLLSIFMVILLVLMIPDRRKIVSLIIVLCTIAVLGGFSFYTYGYLMYKASETDVVSAVLSATTFGLYNTFRMFHNEHDYEIAMQAQSLWLRFLFWLSHLSAVLAFNLILLNIFGRKIVINNLLIRLGAHKKVYIIKGNEENALFFGKDLVSKKGNNEFDERLNPNDNVTQASSLCRKSKWRKIWDDFFNQDMVIYWLEDDDDEHKMYEKATHFMGIVKVISDKEELSRFLESIGLIKGKKLSGYFVRNRSYKIIFMPNDISVSDDVSNVVELIGKDLDPDKLELYVMTASEWERSKIKTLSEEKKFAVHFVNEIDLIARQMIEKLPPHQCPNLNFHKGVASKDFKVLILGFGQMGQSALLRLVMNGQFFGSKMQAIIVDGKIDENKNKLKDSFIQRYPEIERLCCNLKFKDFDVSGKSFYDFLEQEKGIDYIVIATHDDEINKQTATQLKLHFGRMGIPLPSIAMISDPENRGYVENTDGDGVFIFGCREDIFTESVIIREITDKMAKAVNISYGVDHPEYYVKWENLDWASQESNRASADFIPTMLFLAGIEEVEAQKLEKKPITDDPEIAENLAITEHLRWNAFHACTGWKTMSIEKMLARLDKNLGHKDKETKEHPTLVRWDELDAVSLAFGQKMNDPNKDYKNDDRKIVYNIPAILRCKGNI